MTEKTIAFLKQRISELVFLKINCLFLLKGPHPALSLRGGGGSCCRGSSNPQRGSLLFYILLGVILFAALSYVVMNMVRSGGDYGASEQAKLQAHALVEYAQKAKITVQDMRLSGIAADDLVFLKSGDAGYTTAPHTNKVFHPNGGGLPITTFPDALAPGTLTPAASVYMTRTAIDDVGTAADDVIVSVRGVRADVCAAVNQNLVGSSTIPSTGANNHQALFITGASNLTTGVCAGCAGHGSLCVSQTGPTIYTFYSAIDPN